MKQLSLLKIGLFLICGSVIIAGIYIFNSNPQNNIEKTETSKNTNIARGGGVSTSQNNQRIVDVPDFAITENPEPNIETQKELAKKIQSSSEILAKEFDYGVNAPVESNKNAQTASVALALQDPSKYPERLSVAHQPKPFDLKAYQNNPKEYLSTIEPARVFQSAQPAEGVAAIERISEKFPVIKQKQNTLLKVKVTPEMPVTFTSFDLGRFENDLNCITVKADQEGFAACTFTGSEGTIGRVNILAACPVTSGQVKFVIDVIQN